MARITAAEARALAGPTIDERVDDACERIEGAARARRRSIKLQGNWWGAEGADNSSAYIAASGALIALGFAVMVTPGSDPFVTVSW